MKQLSAQQKQTRKWAAVGFRPPAAFMTSLLVTAFFGYSRCPQLFSCIYLTAECANYLDDFTFFMVQSKSEKTNTCTLVNKQRGLHNMKYGNS